MSDKITWKMCKLVTYSPMHRFLFMEDAVKAALEACRDDHAYGVYTPDGNLYKVVFQGVVYTIRIGR